MINVHTLLRINLYKMIENIINTFHFKRDGSFGSILMHMCLLPFCIFHEVCLFYLVSRKTKKKLYLKESFWSVPPILSNTFGMNTINITPPDERGSQFCGTTRKMISIYPMIMWMWIFIFLNKVTIDVPVLWRYYFRE